MHNAHAMVSSVAVFAHNPGQYTCSVEARFYVLYNFGETSEILQKTRES